LSRNQITRFLGIALAMSTVLTILIFLASGYIYLLDNRPGLYVYPWGIFYTSGLVNISLPYETASIIIALTILSSLVLSGSLFLPKCANNCETNQSKTANASTFSILFVSSFSFIGCCSPFLGVILAVSPLFLFAQYSLLIQVASIIMLLSVLQWMIVPKIFSSGIDLKAPLP